ncbi:ABC transporter permease [Mesorhizobium sp. M7A.F.Ca.US.011.01.1.1]|uniref:ABC transporter permease n=1 Tax=Mesorhizobium sp. M7A.F.Ca.US.011.01.1.1 TaxID=2496741 RepID=UPI000FCA319E|nr:ABC transporter permease [Mesorhizobium sp. M7A.F.Ca.US.011.01.1.1]RUX21848.1 ABC transporter permease [Mesorhizobium sp. M7A.F.Ca.US.011.01.1.1]
MKKMTEHILSSNMTAPVGRAGKLPGRWLVHLGPLFAIVVLAFFFELVTNSFLSVENIRSILEAAAIPVIIAVAVSFVIIAGAIDLSAEGVISASSMITSLLVLNSVNSSDLGLWGIAIALGFGLMIGVANGAMNAILRMPSLIVTLGSWFICLGIAAILFPDTVPRINDESVLNLAQFRLGGFSMVVYIAIVCVAVGYLILNYSSLGRSIYAIGGDEGILKQTGLPIARYKIAAFGLSGLFAALAGILMSAQLGNGNANIGEGLLFPGISAAVLGGTLLVGGKGGALQSAVGALLLEVLNNGLIQLGTGPYTRSIISGAIIITVAAAAGWHARGKLQVVK